MITAKKEMVFQSSTEVTVTTTWPAARKQGLGTSKNQKCVW